MEKYTASANRYDNETMGYNRCGRSGVLLPKVSLGFWHTSVPLTTITTARR